VEEDKIKKIVREGYAKIAKKETCCCGPETGKKLGYTEEELISLSEGTNISLGCGNPVALASLKEGETVLDLGSGMGLDCFIASKKVGEKGKVIGVDMTPEMIDKARENARKGNYKNVEFRLGEIESLPVADSTVDVIISNCVINLSPDKKRVFEEAFRTLKPGGRLMISDIVLLKGLPETIKKSKKAYIGCVAGAVMKDEYIALMREAGFQEVKVIEETRFSIRRVKEIASSVASVKVYGIKPK